MARDSASLRDPFTSLHANRDDLSVPGDQPGLGKIIPHVPLEADGGRPCQRRELKIRHAVLQHFVYKSSPRGSERRVLRAGVRRDVNPHPTSGHRMPEVRRRRCRNTRLLSRPYLMGGYSRPRSRGQSRISGFKGKTYICGNRPAGIVFGTSGRRVPIHRGSGIAGMGPHFIRRDQRRYC